MAFATGEPSVVVHSLPGLIGQASAESLGEHCELRSLKHTWARSKEKIIDLKFAPLCPGVFVIACADNSVHMISSETGEGLLRWTLEDKPTCLAVNLACDLIAIGLDSGRVAVISSAAKSHLNSQEFVSKNSGTPRMSCGPLIERCDEISFRRRESVLTFGGQAEFDVQYFPCHSGPVTAIAIDDEQNSIVSVGQDKVILSKSFRGTQLKKERLLDGIPNNLCILNYDDAFLQNKAHPDRLPNDPLPPSKVESQELPKNRMIIVSKPSVQQPNPPSFGIDSQIFMSFLKGFALSKSSPGSSTQTGPQPIQDNQASLAENEALKLANERLIKSVISLEKRLKQN